MKRTPGPFEHKVAPNMRSGHNAWDVVLPTSTLVGSCHHISHLWHPFVESFNTTSSIQIPPLIQHHSFVESFQRRTPHPPILHPFGIRENCNLPVGTNDGQKVKILKFCGHNTSLILWLKFMPKVSLFKFHGQFTFSML